MKKRLMLVVGAMLMTVVVWADEWAKDVAKLDSLLIHANIK